MRLYYVDESGNTGLNLDSPDQPVHWVVALWRPSAALPRRFLSKGRFAVNSAVIARNTLLQLDLDAGTRVLRALWNEPARMADARVALIDVWDPLAYPEWMQYGELISGLEEGTIRKIPLDPHAWRLQRREADLLAGEKKLRDRRYSIIKEGVTAPDQKILYEEFRGAEIRRMASAAGVDLKTVRGLLRIWWQRGQAPAALLPDYHACGGRGVPRTPAQGSAGPKRGRPRVTVEGKEHVVGINADERVRRLLVLGAKRFYEGEKQSAADAFHLTLKHYFAIGHEPAPDGKLRAILPPEAERPTLSQFRYHYERSREPERALVKRKGLKSFLLNHRPLLGDTSQLALGPGMLYEVDSTIADLGLLSVLRRTRMIGRPVLYVVRDRFSRLIVRRVFGPRISLEIIRSLPAPRRTPASPHLRSDSCLGSSQSSSNDWTPRRSGSQGRSDPYRISRLRAPAARLPCRPAGCEIQAMAGRREPVRGRCIPSHRRRSGHGCPTSDLGLPSCRGRSGCPVAVGATGDRPHTAPGLLEHRRREDG